MLKEYITIRYKGDIVVTHYKVIVIDMKLKKSKRGNCLIKADSYIRGVDLKRNEKIKSFKQNERELSISVWMAQ